MVNLAAQRNCKAFAAIKSSDRRVKIMYSVGYYIAPMVKKLEDQNHGKHFEFRGYRTKRYDPQVIPFSMDMLQVSKFKTRTREDLESYFTSTVPAPIIPLNDTEGYKN